MEAVEHAVEAGGEVRALLSAAGIHPDEQEIALLIASYPGLRRALDRLYAVPGAADPAPVQAFSVAAVGQPTSVHAPAAPAGSPS